MPFSSRISFLIKYLCRMTWILLSLFIVGYFFIVIEHAIKIDKAATALIMGVLCWVAYAFLNPDPTILNHQLNREVGKHLNRFQQR
jgi:membrane-bound ClpP family serine protease